MKLKFEHTAEFNKDLKKLLKQWRSLSDDVRSAEAVLAVIYGGNPEIYKQFLATKRATILSSSDKFEVVKMRLDCKSLGNDKMTRIVFIAMKTDNVIKFIELYSKNKKNREEANRWKKYAS